MSVRTRVYVRRAKISLGRSIAFNNLFMHCKRTAFSVFVTKNNNTIIKRIKRSAGCTRLWRWLGFGAMVMAGVKLSVYLA